MLIIRFLLILSFLTCLVFSSNIFGFTRYWHRPYKYIHNHTVRYTTPYNFYLSVPTIHIYKYWIRYRVPFISGYRRIDDYPHYIHLGYSHRYSKLDDCNYQLINNYSDEIIDSFSGQKCNESYDLCAEARDNLNYDNLNNNLYFCSEVF